jgi:hypothetical protein
MLLFDLFAEAYTYTSLQEENKMIKSALQVEYPNMPVSALFLTSTLAATLGATSDFNSTLAISMKKKASSSRGTSGYGGKFDSLQHPTRLRLNPLILLQSLSLDENQTEGFVKAFESCAIFTRLSLAKSFRYMKKKYPQIFIGFVFPSQTPNPGVNIQPSQNSESYATPVVNPPLLLTNSIGSRSNSKLPPVINGKPSHSTPIPLPYPFPLNFQLSLATDFLVQLLKPPFISVPLESVFFFFFLIFNIHFINNLIFSFRKLSPWYIQSIHQ